MFYTKKELALKESAERKKGKGSFIWNRMGGMIMDMRRYLSFIGQMKITNFMRLVQ